MMLHTGAGHNNNCQIILKFLGYDIFCKNLQHKKISSKFGGIRDINHLRYEQGEGRVMLHTEAGHSNNNAIFPNPWLIRGNLSARPLSISTY